MPSFYHKMSIKFFCNGKYSHKTSFEKEELLHKKPFIGKGQIISEQNCGVLNFPKKQQKYCKDFGPCH